MIRALCACALLAAALPARAETLLHLGETATIMTAPDELTAILRAEAVSASAADAQSRVNAAMHDALAQAHQVQGVTVATGGYGVWRTGPTPQDRSERWQASQVLTLSSHDGAALLTLVGTLQQKGLALGTLNWHLSRAAEHSARQEATKQALTALRRRGEEAAGLLDLRFSQFKDVRLDSAPRQVPLPRMAGAIAMAAAPAPPSAEAEDVPVSATAEADIILLPQP